MSGIHRAATFAFSLVVGTVVALGPSALAAE